MSVLDEVRAAVNDAQRLQASWNEPELNQLLNRIQRALDVLDLKNRQASAVRPASPMAGQQVFQALALLEAALGTAFYRDALSTEMVVVAEPLKRVVELLKTVSSG